MNITTRNDLEKHNIFVKILRIVTVPIMNNIPKSVLQKMMHKTSKDASTVVKTGGSTMALEAMYTRYNRKIFSRGILQGLADLFWHHAISQPKALRNRLAIVEEVMESRLEKLIKGGQKDITILNVGGGSSRALIQTIIKLKKNGYVFNPKIINIDKDQRGIDTGKRISKEFGLEDIFTWIRDDARNLKNLVTKNSVDIAEMVGLMDYFDDERANIVLSAIYEKLKDGGLFVVANVKFNREMKFVDRTGWPSMYYRDSSDIEKIILGAEFTKNINLMYEPMKVHMVAIVEK